MPDASQADPEIAAAMFNYLVERVRSRGEPRPGTYLREAGHTGTVVCETCGTLPADGSTEWMHLCHEAIDHVGATGHRVAVDTWAGAIYGPDGEVNR